MDADNVYQRPKQDEAENGRGIIEVDSLRASHGERPVEGWELGWLVGQGPWVDYFLEEFVRRAGNSISILLATAMEFVKLVRVYLMFVSL